MNMKMQHLMRFAIILAFAVVFSLQFSGCASGNQQPVINEDGTQQQPSQSGSILPWQSGGMKVGYIRSDVISKEYAEYRDADNSLQEENRRWLSEVEEKEEQVRSKETELNDLALILSDERKQKLQEEITELKKDLQKFKHDTWYDENSRYVQRRKELMEPIDARVNDAIWKVSKAKNLDMVFDTVSGNVVYVKPELDITDEVLEELEK